MQALDSTVLTYKTVRSVARECYPRPNLQPVRCGPLLKVDSDLRTSNEMLGSWAVSFGMPSKTPAEWRTDIEATRNLLHPEKRLSVSVVGSVQEGWTIDDLAEDYAQCARVGGRKWCRLCRDELFLSQCVDLRRAIVSTAQRSSLGGRGRSSPNR